MPKKTDLYTIQNKHCLNCESKLQDEYKYCPECGQKVNDKLSIGVLFNNLIHNYFSVDARFFRSFVPLLFKPGFLSEKYIEGKRLKYLHPIQLYLFVSIVFFFLFSIGTEEKQETFDTNLSSGFTNNNTIDTLVSPIAIIDDSLSESNNLDVTFGFNENDLDSLIRINSSEEEKLRIIGLTDKTRFIGRYFYSQILKIYEQRGKGILGVFYDSIPISIFFLLPLFALLLKLLFYRKGPYSYHLVHSFYFFSFLFALFAFFELLSFLFTFPNWVPFVEFLMFASYLFIGIQKFYKIKWWQTIYKSLLLLLLNLVLLMPLSFIIILIMTLLFY